MSGARNYEELCIAAKNEEGRLVELEKRQQYERSRQRISARYSVRSSGQEPSGSTDTKQAGQPYKQLPRCYICNSPTHLARDCRTQRSESEGRSRFTKKPTLYIAVISLMIVHQGRVIFKKLLKFYFRLL